MERLARGLVVALLILGAVRGLVGCGSVPEGPSKAALCSDARDRIIAAKAERNGAMTRLAQAKDAGAVNTAEMEREIDRLRQKVEDVTREARALSDCDIGDLVGPNVGR